MQYFNFMSKTIFFSTVSIYGLLVINKFTAYFFTSTVLTFSLRLKILLITLKISFFLFFHNLLFQNMLINLAEKESLNTFC